MSSFEEIQSKYIETDFFDLNAIYKIGRSHQYDETNPIDIFPLSKEDQASLEPFVSELTKFLKTTSSQKFKPFFIELSLYEPSDPNGKTFYSLLLSHSKDAFDCYEEQMKENISTRIHDDSESTRGIIIPNPSLYNSTYFYCPLNSKVVVQETSSDKMHTSFGYFKDPEHKKLYQGYEDLKISVGSFFNNVVSSFETIKNQEVPGSLLNVAMLIPLYRPASTIDNKSINMFKGGGIFIYGAAENDFNQYEFIIELKTILLKSIFKQTFSQIEGEKISDRLTVVELNTFHHLRTNLQHLPEYLRRVKQTARKVPIESIEKSLLKVETYITYLLSNTLSILKSYQNAIVKNPSREEFKVSELKRLFNRLKDHRWVYLTANSDESISDKITIETPKIRTSTLSKTLPVEPDSLYGIMANYIQNVIQAYLKEKNDLTGLSIALSIDEVDFSEYCVMQFTVLNTGTKIPADKIKSLGILPNSSESSSGLGLYFINSMLNFVGAIRQQKENRYFHLENVSEGVLFSFDIKIPK
jgi:hypothetical protein